MKIKNNILALVLSLGLVLAVSGCSDSDRAPNDDPISNSNNSTVNNSGSDTESSDNASDDDKWLTGGDTGTERHNGTISIYNALNEEIGSITGCDRLAFVNGSILYTKANENDPFDPELEYWLYDIETKEDHKLGAFADSYYYAVYESLKHNGHLYISVSSGDSFNFAGSTMNIYDIDLSEYSMKPLLEIKGGVPYNSFTVANNKLIVAELLYNGDTDLVEYDLNEKHDSPVVHAYDESDCFVHDSIRHIYADSNNIYMVRVDWDDPQENFFLYLDKYDFDYNLLDSIDIRDFCVSAYFEDSEWDKNNEWSQCVSYFFVHNDLFYYQNFSATRAIGTIEGDKINRLFATEIDFSNVHSASKSEDSDLFILAGDSETNGRNIIYRVDPLTHKTETAEFNADNSQYFFWSASRDGDKILLRLGVVRGLPDRLYYLDVNDLDFEPME